MKGGFFAFLFLFVAPVGRLPIHDLFEKAGIDIENFDEAGDIGIASGY